MPEDKAAHKIIIEGVTEEGRAFRPSDWAERLSSSLCTFKDRRIYYSPLLQPAVKGGIKCVVVDPTLKESDSALYNHVMDFAKSNNLRVGEE